MRKHWLTVKDLSVVPKTTEKLCVDCKKITTCAWNSSFYASGKPEYKAACMACMRKRSKEYSKRRRAIISVQATGRRRDRKKIYIDYMGGKCYRCGYCKSMRALTFHHKDRAMKEFALSKALDWSWEKVKAELDKCVLVCFNCHMEEEDEYEKNK